MSVSTRDVQRSAAKLAEQLCGQVLLPGDAGYESVRRVRNGLIDKRPAVIARCLGTADVADALAFAIDHGLEIAVRGGGHNVAGRAVCEGGMMIDLGLMRGIGVDPGARLARAQGGATWRDFDRETQLRGLAITGGVVSSTGVAGLTLGGGTGYLMGKFGLTIDSLKCAEVVTASGEVRRASEDENADLFWGLRGGGGNFGIVTSFEFELHPLGSAVHAGVVAYAVEHGVDALRFYRDLTSKAPDEMTVMASLTHAPDGSGAQLAGLAVCHCGARAEAERAIRDIKAFSTPVIDQLAPMGYATLNRRGDAAFPRLALNYWKSGFLAELSDEVIDTVVGQFRSCPSPMSKIIIEHLHGAAARPAPDATAFPHREAGYNCAIASQWRDPADTERNIAWARETDAVLEPFMRGAVYSNYVADEEASAQGVFGANYARLREIKSKYDPDNRFRLNQNILPAL